MTTFLATLRKSMRLSEREAAARAGLSRETLRACERNPRHAKLDTLECVARLLGRQVLVAVVPATPARSEHSTVAASLAVYQDGFESWKIHFMDLVDEFRRSLDPRLLLLPPILRLDQRLQALLAAIVCSLCAEAGTEIPDWAGREHFLAKPWFVSGMESLKASALLESPPPFRRNNIFVLDNFLVRA